MRIREISVIRVLKEAVSYGSLSIIRTVEKII